MERLGSGLLAVVIVDRLIDHVCFLFLGITIAFIMVLCFWR